MTLPPVMLSVTLVGNVPRIHHVTGLLDQIVSAAAVDLAHEHRLGDVVALCRELDVAIEGFHLDSRNGVTQLVLVEAVGSLECLFEDIDSGRCLSRLVRDRAVGRVVGLEAGIPVSRGTEHRVRLRQCLDPLGRQKTFLL
jgi:hypothetical protein